MEGEPYSETDLRELLAAAAAVEAAPEGWLASTDDGTAGAVELEPSSDNALSAAALEATASSVAADMALAA